MCLETAAGEHQTEHLFIWSHTCEAEKSQKMTDQHKNKFYYLSTSLAKQPAATSSVVAIDDYIPLLINLSIKKKCVAALHLMLACSHL